MSLQRARQRKRKYEVEAGRASFSRIPIYSKYRLEDKITVVTERDDIVSEFPATVFVTDNEVKRTYAREMRWDGVGWSRVKHVRQDYLIYVTSQSLSANEIYSIVAADGVGKIRHLWINADATGWKLHLKWDGFDEITITINDDFQAGWWTDLFETVVWDTTNNVYTLRLRKEINYERQLLIWIENSSGGTMAVSIEALMSIVRSKKLVTAESEGIELI
ncbi:MAG: hypothetical protein J7J61_03660 [Candidatus Hydrothermae bacterium]|nr:hypothetical protein [Candidatus Hydrothermae bacterium]